MSELREVIARAIAPLISTGDEGTYEELASVTYKAFNLADAALRALSEAGRTYEQGVAEVTSRMCEALRSKNKDIDTLSAQLAQAREALMQARSNIEEWGAYASDYFQDKWDLAGDLAAIDATLAALTAGSTEGKDG